jgi:hypothetical protein
LRALPYADSFTLETFLDLEERRNRIDRSGKEGV